MSESFPAIVAPAPTAGSAFVYILQSADSVLYIGQTCDVGERLRKHRYGLGSKFTSDHAQPRLVFYEGPMPPTAAISREAQLKRWSRGKKEALIQDKLKELQILARSRDGYG